VKSFLPEFGCILVGFLLRVALCKKLLCPRKLDAAQQNNNNNNNENHCNT